MSFLPCPDLAWLETKNRRIKSAHFLLKIGVGGGKERENSSCQGLERTYDGSRKEKERFSLHVKQIRDLTSMSGVRMLFLLFLLLLLLLTVMVLVPLTC